MWHLLLYSLYPVKLKVPSVCLASGYVVRFVQVGLGIPTPRATLVEQQLLAFRNSESMRLPVRFLRSSKYPVGLSSEPHFARSTPLGSRRNLPTSTPLRTLSPPGRQSSNFQLCGRSVVQLSVEARQQCLVQMYVRYQRLGLPRWVTEGVRTALRATAPSPPPWRCPHPDSNIVDVLILRVCCPFPRPLQPIRRFRTM